MSPASASSPPVRHNAAAGRFELDVDGGVAHADYRLERGVMRMTHTEVPRAAQGQGAAATVVDAALAHARREGLAVLPMCSYVRAYMRRHPATHDLLAPGAAI
jgi:predicted GNAT family acetyltransferase